MAETVFVTYAVSVWTPRRGFDWTDEGFVYTMIASDRIATDVPLGFLHLLHPIYTLTGESVLVFRVLPAGRQHRSSHEHGVPPVARAKPLRWPDDD